MKQTPQQQKLEDFLRSSQLVAGGFLGTDARPLAEIIEADLAELAQLGYMAKGVAARMRELTDVGRPSLGNWIKSGENLEVSVDDYKGWIICPWPHPAVFIKGITVVKRVDSGKTIRWTNLNIHMIEEHNFFEGKGSVFRIEPVELVNIIF